MRTRVISVVIVAVAMAGCSLLLGTSDLSGEATAPAAEASAEAAETDAAVDGNASDGSDAGTLDPSLVALWTFDDSLTAVVKDQSGHGHDLVLSGPQIDPDGGYRGRGMTFTDLGQYATAAGLESPNFPLSGTLSIWFRYMWPQNDTYGQRGIFDSWDNGRAHIYLRRLGSDPAGVFQAAAQEAAATGPYAWVHEFPLTRAAWNHVVWTWDSVGKAAALYVNGALARSGAYGSYPDFRPTQQEVVIGRDFIGSIDEIAIYDRVLPAAEALLLP